jgi:hypothetical protein
LGSAPWDYGYSGSKTVLLAMTVTYKHFPIRGDWNGEMALSLFLPIVVCQVRERHHWPFADSQSPEEHSQWRARGHGIKSTGP